MSLLNVEGLTVELEATRQPIIEDITFSLE